MLGYRRGKAREGRVGGFPEPESVAWKSPAGAEELTGAGEIAGAGEY